MCDLLVLITYLVALAFLKDFQKIEAKELSGEVKKCSDFSIKISNLPKTSNLYELKAEIWDWIEKRLN